jgi:hypothetical protein
MPAGHTSLEKEDLTFLGTEKVSQVGATAFGVFIVTYRHVYGRFITSINQTIFQSAATLIPGYTIGSTEWYNLTLPYELKSIQLAEFSMDNIIIYDQLMNIYALGDNSNKQLCLDNTASNLVFTFTMIPLDTVNDPSISSSPVSRSGADLILRKFSLNSGSFSVFMFASDAKFGTCGKTPFKVFDSNNVASSTPTLFIYYN